jgi:hypothetical protein
MHPQIIYSVLLHAIRSDYNKEKREIRRYMHTFEIHMKSTANQSSTARSESADGRPPASLCVADPGCSFFFNSDRGGGRRGRRAAAAGS